MLREIDVIGLLKRGGVTLPPLEIRLEEALGGMGARRGDAVVSAWWDKRQVGRFAVECKSGASPKVIQSALNTVRGWELDKGMNALVLVPYLSEQRLEEFEKAKISAVDLCGNGIVFIDGMLVVSRTGRANQFASSAPIKNVYRKNSSLVARVFAAKPMMMSVQEILEEVNCRNAMVAAGVRKEMSLSTVSKVLKSIEEDLLVERGGGIRLIQAERLLDNLTKNYEAPKVSRRVRLKVDQGDTPLLERIRSGAKMSGVPWQVTGLSSTSQFAVMQRGEMISIYCPNLDPLISQLSGQETERFPNIELLETDDERVYFDGREREGWTWASPVQTYLELMDGDKRDRETAEQVRLYILREVKGVQP